MAGILEFAVAGGLVLLAAKLNCEHLRAFIEACFPTSPRWNLWFSRMVRVALWVLAATCFLDPLIPGDAELTVTVSRGPAAFPTLLENLRVRVVPLGISGPAGGDRTVDLAFDETGSVDVLSKMNIFETSVNIEVYDQTQPWEVLRSRTVYISPFVRRQLLTKSINF